MSAIMSRMSKMFTRRSNKDRASPNNTIFDDNATIIDDITLENIDKFDERIRNFTYTELRDNIRHYQVIKRVLEKTARETKLKELRDKITNDASLVAVAIDHMIEAKRIRYRVGSRVAPAPSGGRSRRPRKTRKTRRSRRLTY